MQTQPFPQIIEAKKTSPVPLRLSLGSAIVLGLHKAAMEVAPTTLYTMLGSRCMGACRFCAQARDSAADPRLLSRVIWPAFDLEDVLSRLDSAPMVRRICVQTLLYPGLPADLVTLVERIRAVNTQPISVCMNPVQPKWLVRLKAVGVERVGVGLDCATEEIFRQVKPGFHWDRYHQFLDEIMRVFGQASVHLIVGLGESDEALLYKIQEVHDQGVSVALFAFTPIRGTRLRRPAPEIGRYRALQLAHYLMAHDQVRAETMTFEQGRLVRLQTSPLVLLEALREGAPFRTSGCPDCNRPLYNERPSGPRYNYPAPLGVCERLQAYRDLLTYLADPTLAELETVLQEDRP